MTVTKITEISKSKLKITIDEEFAFVLYKGELHHYRLQEGEEISDEVYSEIMEEILPKSEASCHESSEGESIHGKAAYR